MVDWAYNPNLLLSDSTDHYQYIYNAVVCYAAQVIAITIYAMA